MAKSDAENYEGPGALSAAYGQSTVDNLKGTVIGGVAGAGIAAVGTKFAAAKSLSIAQSMPIFGELIKGPAGVIVAAGAVGALALSSIMGLTGFFSGFRKVDRAQKQFYQMKGERDAAVAQVQALQASEPRRFSDSITPRRYTDGFAAGVQAERTSQSSDINR